MTAIRATYSQYRSCVVRHLRCFPRFPRYFTTHDYEAFHRLVFGFLCRNETGWPMRSALLDAFGDENADWEVIAITARSGYHAYNTLLSCVEDGIENVQRLAARNACETCRRAADGRHFAAAQLIDLYERDEPSSDLLPHIHCAHAHSDAGGWCRCTWARPWPRCLRT